MQQARSRYACWARRFGLGLMPLPVVLVIMIGAAPLPLVADGVATAITPLVGLFAPFIVYVRWSLTPYPAHQEMIGRRLNRGM